MKRSPSLPLLACLLAFPSLAAAQSALTEEQRNEYARQFHAGPGPASAVEMKILLDAQERRVSLPSQSRALEEALREMPSMQALATGQTPELGYLLAWNEVALLASSLDHYTERPADAPATYAEQFGPARASRALAIAHWAMFEAVNVITKRYESYGGIQEEILGSIGIPAERITPETVSVNRAIVAAGFETLAALYPGKRALFENARDLHLPQLGSGEAVILGAAIGESAAKAVLDKRKHDFSELPDLSSDDFSTDNPRLWSRDPVSGLIPALGGNWARVTPFAIASAGAHRPPPPPAFDSPEFIAAYKEVKTLGGDPHAPAEPPRWPTTTTRSGAAHPDAPSPEDNTNQTFVGIFWGYDGTALLCAPPRLYNMIATSVALRERPLADVEDMACYLAYVNLCMADAGISAWEAKYHYLYPRPVTYIRAASADDTPQGRLDPRWTPLGAPVTNGGIAGRNLTPPFPAYPSGHATFGGAIFRAMARFLETGEDGIPFKFVSDEYNGFNRAPGADAPRKRVEASFASFKEAQDFNALSRVYIGVHWSFDSTAGVKQGNEIADYIYPRFVKKRP